MPELFTIQQARELIPWLQKSFDAMQPAIDKLDNIRQDVLGKTTNIRSNGGGKAAEEMTEAKEILHHAQTEMDQMVEEKKVEFKTYKP